MLPTTLLNPKFDKTMKTVSSTLSFCSVIAVVACTLFPCTVHLIHTNLNIHFYVGTNACAYARTHAHTYT